MAASFTEADEVRQVAQPLISQHHGHLLGTRMEYVFRSETQTKGDKEIWGTARKISSLSAYLAGQEDDGDGNESFFVITISKPVWGALTELQRTALVDHELAHCWQEEEYDAKGNCTIKRSILPHDLEEFNAIYQRYGDWKPDVREFEKIMQRRAGQLSLLDEDEEAAAAVGRFADTMREHGATLTMVTSERETSAA